MSRSYRKNVFDSYVCYSSKSMKAWRTQENRRLRHNSKQLINTCEDYDALILPVLDDYDTMWGSPQDGKKHIIYKPALNQCDLDYYEYVRKGSSWNVFAIRYHGYANGHFKDCRCYSNKRSYYWKVKRK